MDARLAEFANRLDGGFTCWDQIAALAAKEFRSHNIPPFRWNYNKVGQEKIVQRYVIGIFLSKEELKQELFIQAPTIGAWLGQTAEDEFAELHALELPKRLEILAWNIPIRLAGDYQIETDSWYARFDIRGVAK